MQVTAKEIAEIIDGQIIGDPKIEISSYASISDAKRGDLSFLGESRYNKWAKSTKASILITSKEAVQIKNTTTIIKVQNPQKKFIEILNIYFLSKKNNNGISHKSDINKSTLLGNKIQIDSFCTIQKDASIGNNCSIGPNTFIGERVKIGNNCNIGPNVSIYHDSEIGNNCIIHAGTVIGSDGFGFISEKNRLKKVPQIGKVIIKNNVEIGANCTIDRGALSNTIINNDVKLDNLIQVGHNVEIGKNTLIAAQTAIAGSSKIGERCMIGGQVAISGHISIGNNVKIAGKSGVIKNIKNNATIQGPMAYNIKDFQRSYVHFKNLPNIVSNFNKIKKYIEISTNHKK